MKHHSFVLVSSTVLWMAAIASGNPISSCPTPGIVLGAIPGLGEASACGNVAGSINAFTLSTPGGGTVPNSELQSWMGYTDFYAPLIATEGSGVLFPSRTFFGGDTISFDATGVFPAGTAAVMFVKLNGTAAPLFQVSVPSPELTEYSASVVIRFETQQAGAFGFGVLTTVQEIAPALTALLDPPFTISGLTYTPANEVPEPAALWLAPGIFWLFWLRRRQRPG